MYTRLFGISLLLILGYAYVAAPPLSFVPGTTLTIARGESLTSIAEKLRAEHIITHAASFKYIVTFFGEGRGIQAGAYRFTAAENAFVVARRMIVGDYGVPPARITFIEGSTVREMAAQINELIPTVTQEEFIALANADEGYLFPDTYLFSLSTDAPGIRNALRDNFEKKITTIQDDIRRSGHSLSEIVTMASLVEKEASTAADRRIVAGILWNRLARNMPLQVDAVFGYIFNRSTYSPSPKDLKVDSPYNTYAHRGLPPGPIGNPGLDALQAAASSTATKYLYYLTGNDGLMRYAATYTEHQANLKKYLY